MSTQEALILYAGLFEQIWDQDTDSTHSEDWDNYEKVIQELRDMGAISGRNTYLEAIEDKRSELPF